MPGALVGVLGCFRNAAGSKQKVQKGPNTATSNNHHLAQLLSTYLCLEPEQDQVVLVQQQHEAKRGWHLSSNLQLRLEMATPQVEMAATLKQYKQSIVRIS